MNILGISAFYHDSVAVLVRDGDIIAAVQEERFTRKKHDNQLPTNAVEYCLQADHLTAEEIDYVVFYEKPLRKFERLLETYIGYAPRGFKQFFLWVYRYGCGRSCICPGKWTGLFRTSTRAAMFSLNTTNPMPQVPFSPVLLMRLLF